MEIAKSGRPDVASARQIHPSAHPFKVSKSRRALPCPPFPLPFEPRRCSELIAKDSVRIGVPIKWRGGLFGWISSWQHPACLRVPGVTRDELRCELQALAPRTSRRMKILDQLTSDKGVELEEVDPNDPAFTKREDPVPNFPPAAPTRPLRSFRRRVLADGWPRGREQRGGILATRWAWAKRFRRSRFAAPRSCQSCGGGGKGGKGAHAAERPGPTLIAEADWRLCSGRMKPNCTQPGSLSVLAYYSDRKTMSKETLEGVDVVLTTYLVEGEWRGDQSCNGGVRVLVQASVVPCGAPEIFLRARRGANGEAGNAEKKQNVATRKPVDTED